LDTDEPIDPVTVGSCNRQWKSAIGGFGPQDIVSFDPNDIDAGFEELACRGTLGRPESSRQPTHVVTQQAQGLMRHSTWHQLYPKSAGWVKTFATPRDRFSAGEMTPTSGRVEYHPGQNKARIEGCARA